MPNAFAYVVLFSWPLVAWILFRKLPLIQAFVATVMLGYLFIPELTFFKVPMLPPISKDTMPSFCAAVGIILARRAAARKARQAARRAGTGIGVEGDVEALAGGKIRASRMTYVVPLIVAVLFPATILTWYTNQEPLIYGPRYLQALKPYDIGGMMLQLFVQILPLFLARKELRDREALVDFLRVFAICGLIYTPFIIWEERMSPQINMHLYGFFPASFVQHIRDGAYRPIVFLAHGLRVGIFLTMAVLAAATLFRAKVDGEKRARWLWLSLWLMVNLALSHNFGATLIAGLLLLVVLFLPLRFQFWLAGAVALLVLLYPIARGGGLIPGDSIKTLVGGYSEERAGSLGTRLDNEDELLAWAAHKPLTGWGGWGRNRIYDPESGRDMSITDGTWVMVIGTSGWIGYLGLFGLICLPILFSMLRAGRYKIDIVGAGVIMLLVANIIDLIPNSSMVPILWITAGAVWGQLEASSAMAATGRLLRRAQGAATRRSGRAAAIDDGPQQA